MSANIENNIDALLVILMIFEMLCLLHDNTAGVLFLSKIPEMDNQSGVQ